MYFYGKIILIKKMLTEHEVWNEYEVWKKSSVQFSILDIWSEKQRKRKNKLHFKTIIHKNDFYQKASSHTHTHTHSRTQHAQDHIHTHTSGLVGEHKKNGLYLPKYRIII